jgi:hypothetical protein
MSPGAVLSRPLARLMVVFVVASPIAACALSSDPDLASRDQRITDDEVSVFDAGDGDISHHGTWDRFQERAFDRGPDHY